MKGDLRIEALAERVHMSPRNFARLYAKTRGRTPAKAVEAIRVDAARRRLEDLGVCTFFYMRLRRIQFSLDFEF